VVVADRTSAAFHAYRSPIHQAETAAAAEELMFPGRERAAKIF
jgi:hypothetical protein